MVDTQGPSSTTLLDRLASLDSPERRELATIVRGLSETLAEDNCQSVLVRTNN